MEKKVYAAVVRDYYNVIIGVYERPTLERAHKAGSFYANCNGRWYGIAEGREEVDMYKAMINF